MFCELPWRNPSWWCSQRSETGIDGRHRDLELLVTPLCRSVLSNLLSPPPSSERAGGREPKAASFRRKRFLLHEAGRQAEKRHRNVLPSELRGLRRIDTGESREFYYFIMHDADYFPSPPPTLPAPALPRTFQTSHLPRPTLRIG